MSRRVFLLPASILALFFSLSCESERPRPGGQPGQQNDGGGTQPTLMCPDRFEAADACGGDPSGTWSYELLCSGAVIDRARELCPGGTFEVEEVSFDGELTIENQTYSDRASWVLDQHYNFPVSCLAAIGGCEAYEAAAIQAGLFISCEESNQRCDCTGTAGASKRSQGSALVMTSTLTLTSTSGTVSLLFCAGENELILRESYRIYVLQRK